MDGTRTITQPCVRRSVPCPLGRHTCLQRAENICDASTGRPSLTGFPGALRATDETHVLKNIDVLTANTEEGNRSCHVINPLCGETSWG